MKEFHVDFTLRHDGSPEDESTLKDFIRYIMQARRDFSRHLTNFDMSEYTADEDVRIETICPLCEKTIPQLIYKRVPLNSG